MQLLLCGQQILQYDMWKVTPTDLWDWAALKEKIAKHGLRNSLLLAPMPTASTAQILGNNESIEAYTSNIYSRRVLSGEFQVGLIRTGPCWSDVDSILVQRILILILTSACLSLDCEPSLDEGSDRPWPLDSGYEEQVDWVQWVSPTHS
jgi:hypothetical protein